MADILAFPTKSSSPAQRAKRRDNHAEIVIFPGVRYERWEQAADALPSAPPRDMLRLVE